MFKMISQNLLLQLITLLLPLFVFMVVTARHPVFSLVRSF